jgi:hypothetical protein
VGWILIVLSRVQDPESNDMLVLCAAAVYLTSVSEGHPCNSVVNN